MSALSYAGIDEAVLIHALYHGTQALGMGRLHDRPSLTVDEIRERVLGPEPFAPMIRFDYLSGRPLKTDIDTVAKTFTTRLYDRDAGEGAAQRIIDHLRSAP